MNGRIGKRYVWSGTFAKWNLMILRVFAIGIITGFIMGRIL